MPKKVISGYPTSGDMSASFDTFATPTNIDFLDNIGLLLSWLNAATPVGVFEIYVSNKDKDVKPAIAADYSKLYFGTTIPIDGTNTTHTITLNQLPFSWVAFKYTQTSGSGTLNLKFTAKEI